MHALITNILASITVIYFIASIYYMIRTNNLGTPFKDSLFSDQLRIKKESTKVRKTIFFNGLMIGIFIVLLYCVYQKYM